VACCRERPPRGLTPQSPPQNVIERAKPALVKWDRLSGWCKIGGREIGVIQQKSLFATESSEPFDYTADHVVAPAAYEGALAFHKYWGKKPVEPLAFLIERLTLAGELVVDPFCGSGVTGFAATSLSRRFLGIDVNPIAGRLSSLLVNLPSQPALSSAFERVARKCRGQIHDSYSTESLSCPATHYLWEKDKIQQIWAVSGRRRTSAEPTRSDYELFEKFETHKPRFRVPRFFKNSRINADPALGWNDLFTGRALRNIELLLDSIGEVGGENRTALELCLSAALGQMSKMVFAITARGKTTGAKSAKIEVGSWVIGFWRPPLHFEVNVWNCFERKVEKLLAGLQLSSPTSVCGSMAELLAGNADSCIVTGDSIRVLSELPDCSVDLILTDPPHSDRAPYLELSELWNAVLGLEPQLSEEIVVSNAKERKKNIDDYNRRMKQIAILVAQKLRGNGSIALQFNARDRMSWEFFRDFETSLQGSDITFRGTFPLVYSAQSVVQDNRRGALTTDYVLLFASARVRLEPFVRVPGWSFELPPVIRKANAAHV